MRERDISRRELIMPWLRGPRSVRDAYTDDPDGFVRPPGAVAEPDFALLCDGCGACLAACPERAIAFTAPPGASARTPGLWPERAPCRLCEGLPCAAACPTGALRPIPRHRVDMGVAIAHPDRCRPENSDNGDHGGCDDCQLACPLESSAVRKTARGLVVDGALCVGCGLCVYFCVASPRALEVIPARRRFRTLRPAPP